MKILKQAQEKLYEEGFFSYYEARKREVMKVSYILRSARSEKAIHFLKKELGELKILDTGDAFSFLIEILAEKGRPLEEKVKFVAELSESEIFEVLRLLYYIYPFSYPPLPQNAKWTSLDEYFRWTKECDAFLGSVFENYIMLECALNFKKLPIPYDLPAFLRSIELNDLKKLKEGRNKIKQLNDDAKRKMKKLKYSHPYVRAVLFAKRTIPIVIDGSNIIYSKSDFPDLKNITRLFELFARSSPVYFPYRIIFDKNVRYKIKGSQQLELEKLLYLPHVELYSPADDRIIQLARSLNGRILSYDRFLEYDIEGIEIIKPEDLV
ncbi:hypothetical protein AT15_00670 [Kosmotoga arenicorallina S304]|uniref:Uncharacterized protein n=1 Tax=Kosmotoga arenicorallina S304 TaxID=1453497 RepID=A0A176K0A4_9BACT|nr:hypothetical protein [Kosmotoga arenicorallina]OAA30059.1 hypothetical protein AT15_00670 [Kosmotoga arenicorallina S304]